MCKFIKTTAFLFLFSLVLVSCETIESVEEIISDEQTITSNLTDKIIATATSVNDYNFFVNNAQKTDCDLLSITSGYFNNPEGDYFSFIFTNTESFDMWLTQYNDAKTQAFNTTGVVFSDEDFFISYISNPTGFSGLSKRESMLDYFENCEFGLGDATEYGIPFTDVSSNCDINTGNVTIFIYDDISVGGSVDNFSTTSLFSVEDLLASYNIQNNTNYGVENLKIFSIPYVTPNNEELFLTATKDLTNYFENCMLSRDASENDYLNFIYPIEVNRFNQQLDEVITTTIGNDEDLITTFNIDVGELGFVFPINLLAQNGAILSITSNEELETALDNSLDYVNYTDDNPWTGGGF